MIRDGMTTALYPGSFDPIHLGHVQVIEVASRAFDHVIVAAMFNPQKSTTMFELETRVEMIKESCEHLDNVEVISFSALVVDAAASIGADVIVKGLRTSGDFESELRMAQTNKSLTGIDTLFVPADPAVAFLASTYVREVFKLGGSVDHMVPTASARGLAAWRKSNNQ